MHESLNSRQQQVEEMLRGVVPAPTGLHRDEVMYAAGRAAANSGFRVWAWQGTCACMAVLCAGMLLLRPGPARERTIVMHDSAPRGLMADTQALPMDVSPPRSEERVSPGATYLELRNGVLAHGLEILRAPPGTGSAGEVSHPPALEGLEGAPAWQIRGSFFLRGRL